MSDWRFVAYLWLGRWVIVLPPLLLTKTPLPEVAPSAIPVFAVWALVVSPLVETLLECALPYQLGTWLVWKKRPRPTRPWGFILAAAFLMMIVHPICLGSILAFVTGVFHGYCYAHFAARSRLRAFGFTSLYHAALNAVGVTLIGFTAGS